MRLRIVANRDLCCLPSPFGDFFGAFIPRGGDFKQCHLLLRRGSSGQAAALFRVLAILLDAFHGHPAWCGSPAATGELANQGTGSRSKITLILELMAECRVWGVDWECLGVGRKNPA